MKVETVKLNISGMTCDHCAKTIDRKVSSLEGIISKKVSYSEKSGEFEFDSDVVSKESIVDKINSTGHYKVIGEARKNLSENSTYDLIIIGGGSAAFSAAIKAGELEKKVLMINDGLPIGGTCVNVGCVPSKTLIRTAEQFHKANHPDFNGINPGNNKIDFQEVIRQKSELVGELRTHKYIDVLKDDSNVSILKAFAKLVNKNTVVLRTSNGEFDGKKYTAENILIATGSSTFVPDIPGLADTEYLTNDTLYDLEEIPEHLLIIGGRYIALENAQMFARLGSKVTILQRSERIIPDETSDLSGQLSEYLSEEGIEIKTGVQINSVDKREGKIIVDAEVNDKSEIVEGTHIFIATGRKGNTQNLGLEDLGIETHKNNFLKTDEFLSTNVDNIYAAGDVTGEFLFVYSAAYEGALAVQNMFGGNQIKKDYSIFPWVIFTDPQVAGVGMDEKMAAESGIEYDVSTIQLKDVPRSIAARNVKGFVKLIRNKKTDKLIGARILAPEGSELLMEISLAIKYGTTIAELKNMFHPYLTLSEGVKLAAIGFDKDVNKLSCCAV